MTQVIQDRTAARALGPLSGRVAIVTGGGSGLGEATCEVLARDGAAVVVADMRAQAAEMVAARITHRDGRAVALTLDVADEAQVDAAIERAVGEFGTFDVLVNCAGIDRTLPVDEITPDEWDRIMATNLRGPFLLSRAAFRSMRERGGGHIVNVISTAGKRAWANASAYHASKWGLLGLSHALHVEGRECGIAVTAVIAGGMRTPSLLDRFPDLDPNVLQDPRNVAEAIRYAICQPAGTVIPEITVLPTRESSWP